MIGVLERAKRVFSRPLWDSKQVRGTLQDGSREWITLIACISASGEALPASLIYPAANQAIYSGWVEDIKPGEHSVFVSSSSTGWSNNEIALAWLEQVFDRATKATARRKYRLLILDGHGSHVTPDFIEYANQRKILVMILPPHSTHRLQPLDVCLFSPLARAYSNELTQFLQSSQGTSPVTKSNFLHLFWAAWQSSFQESTIVNSFAATGIWPPDASAVLKQVNNTYTDKEEQSGALKPTD